jgi:hypothetical protein
MSNEPKMIYVVMSNDSPHAVFNEEVEAEKYTKAANAHDEIKNPHRLVFYSWYEFEADVVPPFFGERA